MLLEEISNKPINEIKGRILNYCLKQLIDVNIDIGVSIIYQLRLSVDPYRLSGLDELFFVINLAVKIVEVFNQVRALEWEVWFGEVWALLLDLFVQLLPLLIQVLSVVVILLNSVHFLLLVIHL